MDASANNPSSSPVMATPADNNNPLIPQDETAAILDQTFGAGDSFSVDQEGDSGAEVPIGSAMCEKILESTADRSQDENDTSVASATADDYTGEPTAASTPLRTAMEKFRIIDIEKTPQVRGIQQLESKEGEDNSAGEMDHSSASGDVASAAPAAAEGENIMVSGDAGSTISMPIPLPIQTVKQIPPPRQGESQSKLPQIQHPVMMAMLYRRN
jgi:hypothetical protein